MNESLLRKFRLALAGLFLAALFASVPGIANALTPAGTTIGNSATATYKDDFNNDYTTTSNQVQTVVTAVCGVDILADDPNGDSDPNNTAYPTISAGVDMTGVPGQTVNMGYTIRNTGNAEYTWNLAVTGTYSKTIYYDANQNGKADAGEVVFPGNNVTLTMGETKFIVVQVSVPSGAANGDVDGFTLTADGAGTCDDATTGRVTVNSDANITASKGVSNVSPAPGDTLTYTVTFKNIGLRAAKGRDGWSVDLNNDGDTADANETSVEGILLSDQIPSGAAFSGAVASGSPASNPTGYAVYSPDGTNWYTTIASAGGAAAVTHVGYFMEDSARTDGTLQNVLAVDQQGNFSFTVTVDSPFMEADGCVDNTAQVRYMKSDGTTAMTTVTNTTQSCVSPGDAANIAIGGLDSWAWDGVDGRWETLSAVPVAEEDSGVNYQNDNYANNFPAGSWVSFKHKARNDSAFADVINLAVLAGETSLPFAGAGSIIEFWNSDASAKLIDSDGDGKVDLGTVAGGGTRDFIVKVYLPSNTPASACDNAVDYYVTVISSSGYNNTETDNSRNNIDGVIAADVDIARQTVGGDNQDAAADDNIATPADATNDDIQAAVAVNPASTGLFPFQIVNVGGSSDTYDISRTGGAPPAGSVVKFYEDASCNGTPGAEVTNTGLLGAARANPVGGDTGATFHVNSVANLSVGDSVVVGLDGTVRTITAVDGTALTVTVNPALVSVPAENDAVSESRCYVMAVSTVAGAAAGSYPMRIKALSPTSGSTNDMDVELEVNEVCSITVAADASDQLPAGGSTTYAHTLTNNGNATVNVNVTIPTTPTVLTYTLVADTDANGTDETYSAGTPYNAGTGVGFRVLNLAPGSSFNFRVSVQAPSGTPATTVETITVTALTDVGCSNSLNDTTTVIEGFLQLTKERDVATAAPHDTITYKVTYKNIGDSTAYGVVLTDQIPNNTVFIVEGVPLDGLVPAVAAGSCGDFGLGNTTAADYTVVTALTCAADADAAEYDAGSNLVRFRIGDLTPGQTGSIVFQVLIK